MVTALLCLCVSVCGGVSDTCMCRMKCRLAPMRHTCRHTYTRRGGGSCVRTEGAVRVQRELSLFTDSKLQHSGVLLQCVTVHNRLYESVSVSEWT